MYGSGQNRSSTVISFFEMVVGGGGGGFENINENNQLLNLSFFLYHNLLTEKSNFLIVDLTIFIRLEYMVNYLL